MEPMNEKSPTTAKPIYCPRRRQHAAECETPDACAGGADCRLGPDLNTRMNDWPSVSQTTEILRHKLIADLFDLPVWYAGHTRRVSPKGWHALTVEERDLIADALKQWKPS